MYLQTWEGSSCKKTNCLDMFIDWFHSLTISIWIVLHQLQLVNQVRLMGAASFEACVPAPTTDCSSKEEKTTWKITHPQKASLESCTHRNLQRQWNRHLLKGRLFFKGTCRNGHFVSTGACFNLVKTQGPQVNSSPRHSIRIFDSIFTDISKETEKTEPEIFNSLKPSML